MSTKWPRETMVRAADPAMAMRRISQPVRDMRSFGRPGGSRLLRGGSGPGENLLRRAHSLQVPRGELSE